jgi:hypothetical protein
MPASFVYLCRKNEYTRQFVSQLNGAAKLKRGRPTIRTAENEKIILETLQLGMKLEDAARSAGITYESFLQWRKAVPEFAAKASEAILQSKKKLVELVVTAAQDPKHWPAAMRLLECRFPEEFATAAVQLQLNQQINVNGNGSVAQFALDPVKLERERELLDSVQRVPGTERLTFDSPEGKQSSNIPRLPSPNVNQPNPETMKTVDKKTIEFELVPPDQQPDQMPMNLGRPEPVRDYYSED